MHYVQIYVIIDYNTLHVSRNKVVENYWFYMYKVLFFTKYLTARCYTLINNP